MLNKGLRDEEKEKVSKVFNQLLEMEFVPNLWENSQRQQVSEKFEHILKISLDEIEMSTNEQLCNLLKNANLDFEQYEQFGDILLKAIEVEEENKTSLLAERAITVYETAQKEGKIYSFGLIQKILQAKDLK